MINQEVVNHRSTAMTRDSDHRINYQDDKLDRIHFEDLNLQGLRPPTSWKREKSLEDGRFVTQRKHVLQVSDGHNSLRRGTSRELGGERTRYIEKLKLRLR